MNKIKKIVFIWYLAVSVAVLSFSPALVVFAEEVAEPPASETVIETGDAVSQGIVDNAVNTSDVSTEMQQGSGTESEEAPPGPESDRSSVAETINLTVENSNEAAVENAADISSETGANTASGNSGSASVNTGNAVSLASIFNVVNTNFINASGLFALLSNLGGLVNGIDLRQLEMFGGNQSALGCPQNCDGVGNLVVGNDNTATVDNSAIVRSSTGANEASGNGGNGAIQTGDAYAVADVVNIVNTNFVDSDYLLLTFNNFGSWDGDIVFPPARFFAQLFSNNIGGTRPGISVNNTNEALVENNIGVSADTGANEASDNGGNGAIQTGDAYAGVNAINKVNENIFSDVSFTVLFRVNGNWTGNIFGLPEGIVWDETASGIALYNDPFAEYENENGGGEGSALPFSASIANENAASLANNVQVYALTGRNRANANNAIGTIATGDAFAIANVVNVVNTNVVGKNWITAIVNIMGDWSGNIAFGRPDLWIGEHAEVPQNPVEPHSVITYNFTVTNNGDAAATKVRVTDRFNNRLLTFLGSDTNAIEKNGEVSWNLGTIPPGGSALVSYQARLNEDIPFGNMELSNTVTVAGFEDDENITDNSDSVILLAYNPPPARPAIANDGPPDLRITKSNSTGHNTINTKSLVDYTIVITNKSSSWPAYNALLVDTLKDYTGKVLNKQTWDLGKIYPLEEITVSYSTIFSEQNMPGIYVNEAQVLAEGGGNPNYSYNADSDIAQSSVTLVSPIWPAESSATPPSVNAPKIVREILQETMLPALPYAATTIGVDAPSSAGSEIIPNKKRRSSVALAATSPLLSDLLQPATAILDQALDQAPQEPKKPQRKFPFLTMALGAFSGNFLFLIMLAILSIGAAAIIRKF